MEAVRTFLGQEILISCEKVGDDLNVLCCGGELKHIGAVSVARPEMVGDIMRVSISTISVDGHKEDDLSRVIARLFCKASGTTVAVACGIHYDGIGLDEIVRIEAIVKEMTDELIARELSA
jgi:hypothetical protein